MAEKSNIEWTDGTVNFWWGCQKVSPGCEHCYAETLSNRFGENIWGPESTTSRRIIKSAESTMRKINRKSQKDGIRRTVFVQSMSDFFEQNKSIEEVRDHAFWIMEKCEFINILLLTKRPENVTNIIPDEWKYINWPDNVHLGVSVENQKYADERIPALFDALPNDATKRWISAEPLLGPIDLSSYLPTKTMELEDWNRVLDWVIVGGESGRGSRRMKSEWVTSIANDCSVSNTPLFFKQWGNHDSTGLNRNSKSWEGYDLLPDSTKSKQFPW